MNNENAQPRGWKDVNITVEMPLAAIVSFLNVLNQRLCSLEDLIKVTSEDGQELTITQIYELQARAAEEERAKATTPETSAETEQGE